ncbi:hypothetical protein PA598K_07226, partial [Paenibacillus sp. 598K]
RQPKMPLSRFANTPQDALELPLQSMLATKGYRSL